MSEGVTRQWTLGPLGLVVSRTLNEMRIATRQVGAATATVCTHQTVRDDIDLSGFDSTRFSLAEKTVTALRIEPLSAPRSLVVQLREPITLLPHTYTPVFVSTPIWIGFFHDNAQETFNEIPSLSLRETWFGPNNRDGELCLSCVNKGTIHQSYVDHHPVRALTRLDVSHRGKTPFTLEKLKLPMRYLSLFRDTNGQLHTDGLRVTTHDDRLSLKLAKDVLMNGAEGLELVRNARARMPSSWERALNLMLG